MKKLLLFSVMIGALLAISGCSESDGGGQKAVSTIVIGVPDTPPTIDHENGAGMVAQYMIIDNVMDYGAVWPLVQSREPGMDWVSVPDFSDPSKLVPQLFERIEISDDAKVATYHIRKGVLSAYGNELTTKDIEWKVQRHFALGAVGRFFMAVTDIAGPESLKIVDDYTFQMTSVGPNSLHDYITTSMYDTVWDSTEAKKHATEDDPWAQTWISRNGGGFGAYQVKEWVAGQHIVLEANPNYWQGVPEVSRLVFKVVPESSNRVAMLTKGEIDIATELTPKEIDSLKNEEGIQTVDIPANTNEFLVLNQKLVPAFADVRVRQAVNYVIPKNDIAETAYFGQAKPWNSVFTTVVPGSLPDSDWAYHYDLDKARELMREAGFEAGFDVELYYSSGWPAHETAAIQLRESLDKIGIRVALRKTPTGSFDTLVRSYQAPFAILHEYPALPNGIFNMSLYYLSKPAGGAYGAFGYFESAEVDSLLIDGIRTPFANQQGMSLKAQKKIMEEAPIGWMVESNYTAAIRDNIKGFNWDFAQGTRFHLITKQ